MNKKIIMITAAIVLLGAIATSTYAYNSKLSNKEYLSIMNESIDITSETIHHKGGSQWKALFGSVDDGYLKPEIDRLTILKTGCENLRDKALSLNIRSKDTKEINNTIISKYNNVIKLIDKDIAAKTELLNLDIDEHEKFKKLSTLDPSIKTDIDKNFYEINTLLQKLEIENLK
ncbi:MAG: hypothetical protein ACRC18_07065 [Cetobacterium sp.]